MWTNSLISLKKSRFPNGSPFPMFMRTNCTNHKESIFSASFFSQGSFTQEQDEDHFWEWIVVLFFSSACKIPLLQSSRHAWPIIADQSLFLRTQICPKQRNWQQKKTRIHTKCGCSVPLPQILANKPHQTALFFFWNLFAQRGEKLPNHTNFLSDHNALKTSEEKSLKKWTATHLTAMPLGQSVSAVWLRPCGCHPENEKKAQKTRNCSSEICSQRQGMNGLRCFLLSLWRKRESHLTRLLREHVFKDNLSNWEINGRMASKLCYSFNARNNASCFHDNEKKSLRNTPG